MYNTLCMEANSDQNSINSILIALKISLHQKLQVFKHYLQVLKAHIKLKKHYSSNTINTLLKTPIHQIIEQFNHNVQYN